MYRMLEYNEIIQAGDEVDSSAGWNDAPAWLPARCIGEPAPDPAYPAHRRYRRRLTTTSCRQRSWPVVSLSPLIQPLSVNPLRLTPDR